mgnify:CR=1 FL=1
MSFVSTAGQGKAILTVSRGASHFDFNFQKCFVIPPNSKMTKNLFCFRRLALTFAAVSQCTTLSRESRKFKFLFPSGLSEFCSLRKLVYFDSRPAICSPQIRKLI